MVQEEPTDEWRSNDDNKNHTDHNNNTMESNNLHGITSSIRTGSVSIINNNGTGGPGLPLLKQSSTSTSSTSPPRNKDRPTRPPPPIAASLESSLPSQNHNPSSDAASTNGTAKEPGASFFERPRQAAAAAAANYATLENATLNAAPTATPTTATTTPTMSQQQQPPPLLSKATIARRTNHHNVCMAMSRAESIILSALGDVLVCRSRNSPYPAFANAAVCPVVVHDSSKSGNNSSGSSSVAAGGGNALYNPHYHHNGGTSLENKVAIMCCDVECDDLSASIQDVDICSPWNNNRHQQEQQEHMQEMQRQRSITAVPPRSSSMSFPVRRARSTGSASISTHSSRRGGGGGGGGLLGGAPAEVAPAPLHLQHPQHQQHHHQPGSSPRQHSHHSHGGETSKPFSPSNKTTGPSPSPPPLASLTDRAHYAFRSPPIANMGGGDEDSIVPIRSFDYSHFSDGGNDMVPEQRQQQQQQRKSHIPSTTPSRIARTHSNINNSYYNNNNHHSHYKSSRSRSTAANDNHNHTPSRSSTGAPVSPATTAATMAATMQFEHELTLHQFSHGVASFLPCFAYVKVTKVSAHALGSHVLLISDAGLLYAYGLNDYGQLGIGITTSTGGKSSSGGGGGGSFHRGYVMTPTIVTPLIENGGKAIACAAGVSHSLVVVSTEERRLIKTLLFKNNAESSSAAASGNDGASLSTMGTTTSAYSTEAIVHHQMYGFGRNDYMKIGLVSATFPNKAENGGLEMEVVKLPRRVALRCKVKPETSMPDDMSMPPAGIFAIAASAEHSAALVRRASGDVELYTWGNAMYGSLGLPPAQHLSMGIVGGLPRYYAGAATTNGDHHHHTPPEAGIRVVPVPSFVASLSRTSNPDVQVSSLLLKEHAEYPCAIALGRRCSFVTTSLGRCFSFGESTDGMLGHGQDVTEMHNPSEICFPNQNDHQIVSLSAGACHVMAVTVAGKAYGWGLRLPAGLATRPDPTTIKTTIVAPVVTKQKMPLHRMSPHPMPEASAVQQNNSNIHPLLADRHHHSERAGEDIAWSPEPITFRGERKVFQSRRNLINRNTQLRHHSHNHQHHQPMPPPPPERVVEVCAGYDSSFFVGESGLLFSCGRASGRLGLGEQNQNVYSPRPLLGGLRFWKDVRPPPIYQQQQQHAATAAAPETSSARAPSPPPQNRRHSLGHSLSVMSASLSRAGAARSSSAGTIERKKAPPAPNKPKLRRLQTLD